MNLLRLLLPLLPALLKLLPEAQQTTRHLGRRVALRAVLILIPVLLLLIAAGFAIAAAYMALAAALTPHAAAAIMALALTLIAALEATVLLIRDRSAGQRRAEAARAARASMLQPLEEVGRQIGAKPVQSVLLAAAAGAVVAMLGRRR